MTDDLDLRDALRELTREMLPAEQERRAATIRASFDRAGNLLGSALRRSLPPLMIPWWLPGSISAGSNVGQEITLTGPVRLMDISIRAKTAPSSSECKVRLTANGVEVENASLPPGQAHGRSSITGDKADRAAGEVLRLDVVTAGGAADVTVVLTYTVPE